MLVKIMRGVPGSGKSQWIVDYKYAVQKELGFLQEVRVCSADFFHIKEGRYQYDPAKAGAAHNACLRQFLSYFQDIESQENTHTLFVDNTNTQTWEVVSYYRLAEMFGADVEIVRVECPLHVAMRRNAHDVPLIRIAQMHQNLVSQQLPSHWKERIVLAEF